MTKANQRLASPAWWDELPDEIRNQLTLQGEWLRFRTGQTLLRSDRLPHQLFLLVEGRVRLLTELASEDVVTLALLEPGACLGWAGLSRRLGCETAIAMEDCLVQAIPAARFVALWEQSAELRQLCLRPSLPELASVLLPWLESQEARLLPDPIGFLKHVKHTPGVCRLLAERPVGSPDQSCGDLGSSLVLPSGPTGRCLVLSQSVVDHWLQIVQSTGDPAPSTSLDILRQPGANSIEAPLAPPLPPPQSPSQLGFTVQHPSGPRFKSAQRAEGPVQTALACFQVLASELHFPLPRDTVFEVLDDCLKRQGRITLLQVGQLLEGLGLDVRPLQSPASQLHRINGLALLVINQGFALLENSDSAGIWLLDPTEGECCLSSKEVVSRFPDGVEMLLVRKGLRSDLDELTLRFDLAWFWRSLKPFRPQMLLVLSSGAASKALELIFPLACLQIIDAVVGGQNPDLIQPIAVVLAVAIIAIAILGWLRQLLLTDLADRIDTRLGSQVVSHLFRLPMRFFDRRTVGDLASRLHDLQRVRQFITETGTNTLIDLVFVPVLAITIFVIQPILALIVLLEIPIILAINLVGGPVAKRQLSRRNIAWGKSQSLLVEVITAIKTVKTQNFATQARWRWLERYQRFTGEDYKLTLNRALVKESTSVVERAAKAVLFLAAAWMALKNQISVGAVFGVYLLASGITNPLISLSRVVDQFREARAAMDAVADVLGHEPEEAGDATQNLPMPSIQGHLRFQAVSFSYGLSSGKQLDRFSLDVEAGKFVGLVGLSGSGKSTVVQLLDGLYGCSSGRVFIDGVDISKVQLGSLRRQVGFVPQESILFDGSVLDNIRLNTPDASYEAIVEACRLACAHEFIMQLPNGYNSRVGERGGGLSGGQKQRLAIARMVLQNPRLVILDEATSALDADSETRVMQNLRRQFNGRTILFVTHRLGNLRHADRILVMDQGRLIEDGTWDELLQRQGSFAALARQQHEIS